MKEIKLTQGQVAIVDNDMFDMLNQHKWCAAKYGNRFYAVRCITVNKKEINERMHRIVLDAPNGVHIDHKNGDSLDNRKSNLRFATHQQNASNRHCIKSKTGVKGVSLTINPLKPFGAFIRCKGKNMYLGYFAVLADADEAYRKAEVKYFGEFAREESKNLYGNELI